MYLQGIEGVSIRDSVGSGLVRFSKPFYYRREALSLRYFFIVVPNKRTNMKDKTELTEKEQAVVKAARVLGEWYKKELEAIGACQVAVNSKEIRRNELKTAEKKLPEIELELARERLRVHIAQESLEKRKNDRLKALQQCDEARIKLWRKSLAAANSTGTSKILQFANDFATKSKALWHFPKDQGEAEELKQAEEALAKTEEKLSKVLQRIEFLRSELERLEGVVQKAWQMHESRCKVFGMQRKLAYLACCLNDSENEQFAYGCCETVDLFDLERTNIPYVKASDYPTGSLTDFVETAYRSPVN